MKKIMNQVRQGDVLITPSEIPGTAKVDDRKGLIVLAEGEATGHAHTVARNRVEAFLDGEQLYLRVLEPVEVKHQEHAPVELQPGDYVVRRQTESWMDEVRQVRD